MMAFLLPLAVVCVALACTLPLQAAETRAGLKPCRLQGVEHEAWCGAVQRALDPAQPAGVQIDVHFAVLPALARNRKSDPVMFFAGGPGQSAIELAGTVSRLLARLAYRRDIVLIDQRGTGRSAPLACADQPPTQPLAGTVEPAQQLARVRACLAALKKLPHGDLRHYTTLLAMQDADAVRRALGVERVNLVGGSYGTRAALEYMRQFPQAVRRLVIDGVAPPDAVLPLAMSADNQAAFDAVLAACQSQPACQQRHPTLAQDWRALLTSLPREVSVMHPFTGKPERVSLSKDWLLSLVRAPLYLPALAAALPLAISEAARGRFEPLLGLASALQSRSSGRLSEGMHFSVICNEDQPRVALSGDAPGADFGDATARLYRDVCADWPRADLPEAFYRVGSAPAATLVLSGGADPVTPPRHGERVARLLGAKARHAVVPQAGHGVMSLACMRDVLYRFIDADTDAAALAVDVHCADRIPRPPAYAPFVTEAAR